MSNAQSGWAVVWPDDAIALYSVRRNRSEAIEDFVAEYTPVRDWRWTKRHFGVSVKRVQVITVP